MLRFLFPYAAHKQTCAKKQGDSRQLRRDGTHDFLPVINDCQNVFHERKEGRGAADVLGARLRRRLVCRAFALRTFDLRLDMGANSEICFRRAEKADASAVEKFLAGNERPIDGAAEHLERFWLATWAGQIIGSAGLEIYGEVALLRSVAVSRNWRRQGIGRALVERTLQDAKGRGVGAVYLLTANAGRYFESLGFRALSKTDAPKALLASLEFQGACPASDILMVQALVRPVGPADNPGRGVLHRDGASGSSLPHSCSQTSEGSAPACE